MFKEIFWTWIPWIFNKANVAVDMGKTLVRVLYNELMLNKEWVFLKGNDIPISSQAFGEIDDIYVKWRCSVNPFIFVEPGFESEERHLCYLGFVVKVPSASGTVDIDISDWVNELKWKGSIEPTLKEIFLLWSFTSGESYFHCLNEIQIEYINDMGDVNKKGLNG